MNKNLECFLVKLQAVNGVPEELTGADYAMVQKDSSLEIVPSMTEIETISPDFEQDASVLSTVNANVNLSYYMRSFGDAVAPDFAAPLQASGFALDTSVPTVYKFTPATESKQCTVWHYEGGVGTDKSIVSKAGNVCFNFSISGEHGKPVTIKFDGGMGQAIEAPAIATIPTVTKNRSAISAALPLLCKINNEVYTCLKFDITAGNEVSQMIDNDDAFGMGGAEVIDRKGLGFSATIYADNSKPNPMTALLAVDESETSFYWGPVTKKITCKGLFAQIKEVKVSESGSFIVYDVKGSFNRNDFYIAVNE